MTPSYADKQFLIIDDFSEFRRSVKGIVQQLGALDIDMCGTGEEAVDVPAQVRRVHRGFDDPPRLARGAASEAEAMPHYRRVRDEIRAFVERELPGLLSG